MTRSGFTLIELSIVLVVIGLIVGGIVVGRDLIGAAAVRSQVTQIEKYQQAVNTFRGKYGYLPGDMIPGVAQQFGFTVGNGCNGTVANRDGNGLLDVNANEANASVLSHSEPAIFWNDLSAAGLIEGSFTLATCGAFAPTLSQTSLLMPIAKISSVGSVYIYDYTALNFFGISAITIWPGTFEQSSPVFTVAQAYSVDKKIDDGLPATGHVVANFVSAGCASGQSLFGNDTCTSTNTSTAGGTSSSCYDTTTGTYSVTVNNGSGTNCGISFQFQ